MKRSTVFVSVFQSSHPYSITGSDTFWIVSAISSGFISSLLLNKGNNDAFPFFKRASLAVVHVIFD